ncbi:MAG TPA: bifunctional nuclease family protein [Candidatus Sumerlaeota bacterium]|nr:bifunctional nuclease family protein [Candidatus Sumerlaeota bacterium]
MFIEMELSEIQMSHMHNQQVVILTEKNGARSIPIFIGLFEASAMDFAINEGKAPRPLTHDLIFNVLDDFGLKIDRVLVDSLHEDTFYGKLVIADETGNEKWVDSRPSDAIVLACKRHLPIFVHEDVLNKVSDEPDQSTDSENEPDVF